jgi:hypothetical protein
MTCSGGKYNVYGFCWSNAKCLCNDTIADAGQAAACADGSNPTDEPNDDSPHCRCIPANTDQSCVTTATCTGQGSCTSEISKGLSDGAARSASHHYPTCQFLYFLHFFAWCSTLQKVSSTSARSSEFHCFCDQTAARQSSGIQPTSQSTVKAR